MRLILHIGTEKTGTTALQNWLHQNDAALRDAGIHYALGLGRPVNRAIATIARNHDEPDESFLRFGLDSPERHARFRAEALASLGEEAESARAAGARAFVISSEHCHSRLREPVMIARLAEMLSSIFPQIEVVCVCRPQVDLWLSWISTGVRYGNHVAPDARGPGPGNVYYNYFRLLSNWAAAFDTVTAVPYRGWSSPVEWFCDRFGLRPETFRPPPRVNTALDAHTIGLAANIDRPAALEGAPNMNRQMFIEELSGGPPLSLGLDRAREIQSRFDKSNLRACKLCPGLTPDMLEPDWSRYDTEENLHLLAPVPWADKLSLMTLRFNIALWLERARRKIAEADAALARKKRRDALRARLEALDCLAHAERGVDWRGLDDLRPEIAQLRRRCEKLFE